MMKKLHACTMAAVLFAGFGPTLAPAQDAAANYPSQPIKLMVPWPAGGGVDTTARIVSDMLGHRLGHPFVIDNRAGAGGNIGTELAARQKPDGYNLLMSSISPNAVNASLYSKLGFDPVKDFEPVIYVSAVPNILVVPGDSPFKTAKDVIDAARANPGKLNYASGGIGSSQHLAAVQFASAAKIDIVHVPYKGTAPAEADLAAGHVSLMLDTTTCLPFVASGKMRALAVASKKRNPRCPTCPPSTRWGCPASMPPRGMACRRRPARPRPSSPSSMPRPTRCSSRPSSRSACWPSAPRSAAARPRSTAASWPARPGGMPRSCASRA
jgi:tripartite-type tricarboxylate transporter receptor subunit TctC